jgi:predicted dehydrogenase
MKRKIKMGMIGGGQGAFIGAVHRMAANLDGLIELVCGCFSSTPTNSKQTGESLFLDPNRVYGSYQEMIEKELALPAGERMDFVAIVTPNHMHFEPAKLALENGFHVVVEKPMTFNLAEALELEKLVQSTGNLLCLTHTYSGYPMVKQARALVKKGSLGNIRKVVVQYPQGWLSRFSESEGNKQASWRTNPSTSGKSGAMGDIGTHAAHLAEYITGLRITEICADLSTFVDGRMLDDDGNVLLKFNNGAKGVLIASQISAGEENALQISVYGDEAGMSWKQEDPNNLIIQPLDQPKYIYRTGNGYQAPFELDPLAVQNTRLPSGHPEGMIEAFANIYRNFALGIIAKMEGRTPNELERDFPTVQDGVRGMAFIDAVVASSEGDAKWHRLDR